MKPKWSVEGGVGNAEVIEVFKSECGLESRAWGIFDFDHLVLGPPANANAKYW